MEASQEVTVPVAVPAILLVVGSAGSLEEC